MRLGYTILYVPDVAAAVAFYEAAFGLQRRFMDEAGQYAEMETGATALAFAAEGMAEASGLSIRPTRPSEAAPGVEIAFVTDDPEGAYRTAVEAGADGVHPPQTKPWGQTVAYVRDLNGCLVEICSPMGA